ncbi:MAG: ABC transporter ATP-binding protein [Desulfovibrionaceae bacterium]
MIRLNNVGFTYPFQPEPAVREVSLAVQPGEAVLLTGASGCGKSTVVRLVNGLALHHFQGRQTGQVLIAGQDNQHRDVPTIAADVGTLFQDPESQFFALNVRDELAMAHEWRRIQAERIEQRIEESAKLFGIDHLLDHSTLELSEGQKQKVALASIMSLSPKALVLDEPTANLDPESTEALAQTLVGLKAQGVAILIVDHRLYWLRDVVDRVLVMENGTIAAQGPFSLLDDGDLRTRHGLRRSSIADPRSSLPELNGDGGHIRLEGLRFAYGAAAPIFDDLSINLPAGKVVGLIGPNGVGKTTFAMLLTGLLRARQGRLSLANKTIRPGDLLQRAGLILQNTDHQLHMKSVSEEINASFRPSNDKHQATTRAELMAKYNVSHLGERHPQSLSGGEKQRLVMACGEAKQPDIMILDEPTSGLDGANMHRIADCAREFAGRGVCVLLISHDLELLGEVCDARLTFPLKHN